MRSPKLCFRSVLALCVVLALAMLAHVAARAEPDGRIELSPAPGQQTTDPLEPLPRPIFLYAGSCDELGDIQWPLSNLVSPDGEEGGSDDADRTEYSFTANVPVTIDAMLAGEYAINVHASGEHMDTSIACGNIGGVADSVGTLVVGLREQGNSAVTGIAVLSPSPADPAMTYISVFITGAGLGDAVGTIGVAPPLADDGQPVDSGPPPADGGDDDDDTGDDDSGGGDDSGGDDDGGGDSETDED